MKKILTIIFALFIGVVAILAVLPFFLKDEIKSGIDNALEENINAHVYYDINAFSTSFFTNFPNLTVSLGDFGIIGKGVFEGDTLLSVGKVDLSLSLFSLFGDAFEIESIKLDRPFFNLITLEDGTVNYDIAYPDDADVTTDDTTSSDDFLISISNWEIVEGRFIYNDLLYTTFIAADGINHTGSGDITLMEYDLKLNAIIEKVYFEYGGDRYLSGQSFETDMLLHINMDDFSFTFKDNISRINDFGFALEGEFSMPDDMFFDLSFSTPDNTFKSLLSLLPEDYLADLDDIEVGGTMNFSGTVNGAYTNEIMPGMDVTLVVNDGKFKYPDLPDEVHNIEVDVNLKAPEGDYQDLVIGMKKLHAEFGSNPFDASFYLEGIHPMKIDAKANGALNMGELSRVFPVEGVESSGMISLKIEANGVYDSLTMSIPTFNGEVLINNGKVTYADFPKPITDINVNANFINTSGKLDDSRFNLENLSLYLGDELMSLKASVWDLNNIHWDMIFNGGFDFELVNYVYPIENTYLAGKLSGNISSSGNMDAVENENYDQLPASGSIMLRDFMYRDSLYLPQGFGIAASDLTFTPKTVTLKQFNAISGTSDVKLKGNISNYIAYLTKGDLLNGNLVLESDIIDMNPFMLEAEEKQTESKEDSTTLAAIRIPENIDLAFEASIGELLYSSYELKHVEGQIIAKDGKLELKKIQFNMLEGGFVMNGFYNSIPVEPEYDFDLTITDLSIPAAYDQFVAIQKIAPVAKNMTGKFGTEFSVGGALTENLLPVYRTITGSGFISIANATFSGSNLVDGINSVTKLNDIKEFSLKDVLVKANIENGTMKVAPFDIEVGENQATVSGTNTLDGLLNYNLKLSVPAGSAGAALASYIGSNAIGDKIDLNLNIGGNYENPKISLASVDSGAGAVVQQKKDDIKQEAQNQVNETEEELKAKAKEEKKKAEEKLKEEAKEKTEDLKNKAKKLFGGG